MAAFQCFWSRFRAFWDVFQDFKAEKLHPGDLKPSLAKAMNAVPRRSLPCYGLWPMLMAD